MLTYDKYIALRYDGVSPDEPRTVAEISHKAARIRSGKEAEYEARKRALNVTLDYANNIKRYGGMAGPLTLDADTLTRMGFDPEHLTARVTVALEDAFETPVTTLRDMGYDFRPVIENYDGSNNRPAHHSVKVDYSGPRERSDFRWVTVEDDQVKYFTSGPAWKGMSRGVRAQALHRRLLEAAQANAEYVEKWCADEIQNHTVRVAVYWRGEEVSSAYIGGCEMEYHGNAKRCAEVADIILDYALVDEALDEARKWADDAVRDAQRRAAAIVESIALLPERSISAVRDSFKAATVTSIRRQA